MIGVGNVFAKGGFDLTTYVFPFLDTPDTGNFARSDRFSAACLNRYTRKHTTDNAYPQCVAVLDKLKIFCGLPRVYTEESCDASQMNPLEITLQEWKHVHLLKINPYTDSLFSKIHTLHLQAIEDLLCPDNAQEIWSRACVKVVRASLISPTTDLAGKSAHAVISRCIRQTNKTFYSFFDFYCLHRRSSKIRESSTFGEVIAKRVQDTFESQLESVHTNYVTAIAGKPMRWHASHIRIEIYCDHWFGYQGLMATLVPKIPSLPDFILKAWVHQVTLIALHAISPLLILFSERNQPNRTFLEPLKKALESIPRVMVQIGEEKISAETLMALGFTAETAT